MLPDVSGQEVSIEQYFSYSSFQQVNTPRIFSIKGSNNFIAEFRNGYEADKASSLNIGKSFKLNSKKGFISLGPTFGFVGGSIQGVSIDMNINMEQKSLFATSRFQYFASTNNKCDNFFYSWSEIGLSISPWFYTGLSFQSNFPNDESIDLNKGFLFGLSFGSFDIPIYFFDAFGPMPKIETAIICNLRMKKKDLSD